MNISEAYWEVLQGFHHKKMVYYHLHMQQNWHPNTRHAVIKFVYIALCRLHHGYFSVSFANILITHSILLARYNIFLMPGLTLTLSDVTSFLPDNLSGLNKIIFRLAVYSYYIIQLIWATTVFSNARHVAIAFVYIALCRLHHGSIFYFFSIYITLAIKVYN